MAKILEYTDVDYGREFRAGTGLSQITLFTINAAGIEYTLQVKSPEDPIFDIPFASENEKWASTDVIFDGAGIQTFYTSKDFIYRLSIVPQSPSIAGSIAFYVLIGL